MATASEAARLTACQGSPADGAAPARRVATRRRAGGRRTGAGASPRGARGRDRTPSSTPATEATPSTSGGPHAQVPVARLPPDADARRRHDREQRGGRRLDLTETEQDERGHEEDAAADAEEAREHTGRQPEQHGEEDRRGAHADDQPDRRARRAARRTRAQRPARERCWSPVPASAPIAPGTPTSSAYPTRTSPRSAYRATPASGGDDDRAERGRRCLTRRETCEQRRGAGRSGSRRPTPKSELKVPATSPIAISRHTGVIV